VIAFLSFFVAVLAHKRGNREARLKDEESIARNEETKKYAQTLENFSRAAQFAKHLQGMDERAGTIAGHLETVAAKSSKITETATNQIEKSLEHLRKSTVAIEEIARQLRDIAKAAAAAQRQAITGKQRDDSPR
jgi:methyl-accepting chemotaxis protein